MDRHHEAQQQSVVTQDPVPSLSHSCIYLSATQLPVFRYDDEEWQNLIAHDSAWTREETDYLLEMCEAFDLRFIVIADRYNVGGSDAQLLLPAQCAPPWFRV
jgi:SANT/Myb-like domain of DAMP1